MAVMSLLNGKSLSLIAYDEVNELACEISKDIKSLESACSALGQLKIICDRKTKALKEVESDRTDAVFPDTFLSGVFLPSERSKKVLGDEIVPFDANFVIGANRKGYGYERAINSEVFIDNCQRLTDYAGQNYCQVGILPLYYAGEGKNRVEVFRASGASLVGKYSLRDFPLPTACRFAQISKKFSVAYFNDHRRVLLFPSVTERLLSFYGASQYSVNHRYAHKYYLRRDFFECVSKLFPWK